VEFKPFAKGANAEFHHGGRVVKHLKRVAGVVILQLLGSLILQPDVYRHV
jgi:hypothetical protein